MDIIIAVGGGSVIDSAKGISIGAKYDGDFWDFYCGKIPTERLPLGVVLTLPRRAAKVRLLCRYPRAGHAQARLQHAI